MGAAIIGAVMHVVQAIVFGVLGYPLLTALSVGSVAWYGVAVAALRTGRGGLGWWMVYATARACVAAGVIGEQKFPYDLWGDTVNLASRMESQGVPGRIQVTAAVRERLGEAWRCVPRGAVSVKGRGEVQTWPGAGRRGPVAR